MDEEVKDKFELYLDEMIEKLKSCQDNMFKENSQNEEQSNIKSCSICEKFMACELRSEYVKAVYNSMSKGDTGGFEF